MIRAVDNAIAVIEAIDRLDGEAGVTDLATETGLAKSTVHEHVETLLARGYVVRASGTPELSYRILQLGERRRRRTPHVDAAQRATSALAERTGERAHYSVIEEDRVVFLVTETGETAVRTDVQPGEYGPLHATASGKAILAHLPAEQRIPLLSELELSADTEHTIVDVGILRDELEAIRRVGIAHGEGEYIPNVWSAAAPVFGAEETPIGCLAVSGPASRFRREDVASRVGTALQEAVEELELAIAYD